MISGINTTLYDNVNVRNIKEIENEIIKQKAIVIGIDDFASTEAMIANEKAKILEWVLGVR